MGKAALLKELRRTCVLMVLSYIYTLNKIHKKEQERNMYECFHGDSTKNVVSYLHMLLTGDHF